MRIKNRAVNLWLVASQIGVIVLSNGTLKGLLGLLACVILLHTIMHMQDLIRLTMEPTSPLQMLRVDVS